jgi:hypothetical protein
MSRGEKFANMYADCTRAKHDTARAMNVCDVASCHLRWRCWNSAQGQQSGCRSDGIERSICHEADGVRDFASESQMNQLESKEVQ